MDNRNCRGWKYVASKQSLYKWNPPVSKINSYEHPKFKQEFVWIKLAFIWMLLWFWLYFLWNGAYFRYYLPSTYNIENTILCKMGPITIKMKLLHIFEATLILYAEELNWWNNGNWIKFKIQQQVSILALYRPPE